MSASHHSGNQREESALFKMLRQQHDGTAQRQWPEGRLASDDDGQIAFAVASDPEKQLVAIDFGKPVNLLAMGPEDAVKMAQLLIKHARSVSPKPVRIELH